MRLPYRYTYVTYTYTYIYTRLDALESVDVLNENEVQEDLLGISSSQLPLICVDAQTQRHAHIYIIFVMFCVVLLLLLLLSTQNKIL